MVGPRNRAGKAPGVTICGGQRPCAGGGRPQGSPLRCGRRGRRGWCRASIIFPNSRGNHAGGHRWGRTWKRPPLGERRGAPCGRPPGSQHSPAGRWRRSTGPARGSATTRGGRRRVPGRATTRVAPTMRSPQATRLGPGVDHLPRFPRKSCWRPSVGKDLEGPRTGDRRGAPCGRPPGSQRSPAGWSGRATGPARHPVTICDGQRPCAGEGDHKGRPYDAVAAGDAVGAGRRSPSPIPQGIRPEVIVGGGPGNVHRSGDRRGAPCGCPSAWHRSPAGRWRRSSGPARSPATTRSGRRRVPGRATTRVAPTMWWSRATRLGRASIIIPNPPGGQAGGHRWTWKRPPIRDRRGTPCGCPPGSQRSPAGWSGRATGPARGRVTTCGGRRRVPGRGATRVAPTMWWSRATRLGRASIIILNSPGDRAGGHRWTWKTSADQGP